MNPFEIDEALETMQIIVDTREHKTESFAKRVKAFPCGYCRQKVNFGDYSVRCTLPNGKEFSLLDKVCIERKMSLDELAGNFGTNRARFEREFNRMKEAKGRLWILCENGSFEDMLNHNYRSLFHPNSYIASALAWQIRYDMRLVFCTDEIAPIMIYKILRYELKEALENYEVKDDSDE